MRLDEFSSTTDLDGVLTPTEMMRFLGVGFDIYEIGTAITGRMFVTWTGDAPSIGLTGDGPSIGLTGTRPTITLTT